MTLDKTPDIDIIGFNELKGTVTVRATVFREEEQGCSCHHWEPGRDTHDSHCQYGKPELDRYLDFEVRIRCIHPETGEPRWSELVSKEMAMVAGRAVAAAVMTCEPETAAHIEPPALLAVARIRDLLNEGNERKANEVLLDVQKVLESLDVLTGQTR